MAKTLKQPMREIAVIPCGRIQGWRDLGRTELAYSSISKKVNHSVMPNHISYDESLNEQYCDNLLYMHVVLSCHIYHPKRLSRVASGLGKIFQALMTSAASVVPPSNKTIR